MTTQSETFTEKMIARVTALLGERTIKPSPATLSETNANTDTGEVGAAAGLPAQILRSRIECVLSEDAPRLQRMAKESERLAAGGWGHSAFRVEVERVTQEWAAIVRARLRAQQDEAPGEVG